MHVVKDNNSDFINSFVCNSFIIDRNGEYYKGNKLCSKMSSLNLFRPKEA